MVTYSRETDICILPAAPRLCEVHDNIAEFGCAG